MKYLIIITLLLCSRYLAANPNTILNNVKQSSVDDTIQVGDIKHPNTENIDKLPEFLGGKRTMWKFLEQNLRYPAIAKEFEISGTVNVQFLVDEIGTVKDIKVIQGIGGGCDEEAVRVLKLMPNWKPGSKNGRNVNVLLTINIVFKLPEDELPKSDSQKKVVHIEHDTTKRIIELPLFPGGKDSLYKFVAQNFKYPKDASEKEIEGIINVDFLINKEGKIVKSKVLIKIEPSMDNEVLRLINLLPAWKPALINGKPSEFKGSMEFNFMRANGWYTKDKEAKPKSDTLKVVLNDTIQVKEKNEEIMTFVEELPVYPGGVNAFMNFLCNNVRYPNDATERGIMGRVIVQFVIDKQGLVKNTKIIRGLGGGCSEEAIRVVKSMPKWKPGKQNGKDVPVYFTLPVVFQLKE